MERLTRVFAETTHGTKGYEPVNEIMVNTESICNFSEIITTLGLLEDVLEKWHIEDLDKFIEEQISKKRKLNDILWKMVQELSELKQKAIVPKFEVDQTLFRIDSGSIVPFLVNEIYVHIKADETISIQYFDYVGLVIEENELFATKEEAEQELTEIRRKDE